MYIDPQDYAALFQGRGAAPKPPGPIGMKKSNTRIVAQGPTQQPAQPVMADAGPDLLDLTGFPPQQAIPAAPAPPIGVPTQSKPIGIKQGGMDPAAFAHLTQAASPQTAYTPGQVTSRANDPRAMANFLSGGQVSEPTMLYQETTGPAPVPPSLQQIMAQVTPMMPPQYTPEDGYAQAPILAEARGRGMGMYQQAMTDYQKQLLAMLTQQQGHQLGMGELGLKGELGRGELGLRGQEQALREKTQLGELGIKAQDQALKEKQFDWSKSPEALTQAAILAGAQAGKLTPELMAMKAGLGTAFGGMGGNAPPGASPLLAGPAATAQRSGELEMAALDPILLGRMAALGSGGEAFQAAYDAHGEQWVRQNQDVLMRYLREKYGADALRSAPRANPFSGGFKFAIDSLAGAVPIPALRSDPEAHFYSPEGRQRLSENAEIPLMEWMGHDLGWWPNYQGGNRLLRELTR